MFKNIVRFPRKIPFVQILIAVLPVIFVLTIVLGLRSSMFLDPKISVTINTGSGIIGSSAVRSILDSIAGFLGVSSPLLEFLINTALINVFILTFCAFEYSLAIKFVNDKLSTSLNSFFTYIATSSYCVYLFHRPFFTLWNSGTNFVSSPILREIIMLFVAIPLLFFVSYHIQKIELNLKNIFRQENSTERNYLIQDSKHTLVNENMNEHNF